MQILPTDWPGDDSQGIQHLAESHSHKYNANDKKMQIIKKTAVGPADTTHGIYLGAGEEMLKSYLQKSDASFH